MRTELDELEARLDAAEQSAASLPHRTGYLLLDTGYLRELPALQRKLVDDVERELSPQRTAHSAAPS